jgi:trk system potassium uptake protein TrkA
MKIIIVGAGTVGNQLAARLSEEDHDIIVIDEDYGKLRNLEEYYDLQTTVGDATSVSLLRKVGIENADLVISVTNDDTVNVVVSSLAKKMDEDGRAYRIARIRKSGCFEDHSIYSPSEVGVDSVIYPEEVSAELIINLLQRPFADQVFQFLNSRIDVVGILLPPGHFLVGRTMADLPRNPEKPFRIVAITSGNKSLIPVNWSDKLKAGDRIYIAALQEDIHDIVAELQFDVKPLRSIFIHGGTHIGTHVARRLEDSDIQVRIIDPSRKVTKQLAYELKKALVLHGEGTDVKLLNGEGVQDAQVFVSVTDDENANLLSCLLAKKMGVRKTIALVAKPDYVPLISQLNVDSIISQRLMTINRIMHLVRQGTVMQVEEMVEGEIQALEFRVTNQTVLTNFPLSSPEFRREFPQDTIIGGIMRGEDVIIPEGEASLQEGDRVVVFCSIARVRELESFFALGDSGSTFR